MKDTSFRMFKPVRILYGDHRPSALAPCPGEPQGVLVLVVTTRLMNQLKRLIALLTHAAWFHCSELVAYGILRRKQTQRLSGTRSEDHYRHLGTTGSDGTGKMQDTISSTLKDAKGAWSAGGEINTGPS